MANDLDIGVVGQAVLSVLVSFLLFLLFCFVVVLFVCLFCFCFLFFRFLPVTPENDFVSFSKASQRLFQSHSV